MRFWYTLFDIEGLFCQGRLQVISDDEDTAREKIKGFLDASYGEDGYSIRLFTEQPSADPSKMHPEDRREWENSRLIESEEKRQKKEKERQEKKRKAKEVRALQLAREKQDHEQFRREQYEKSRFSEIYYG